MGTILLRMKMSGESSAVILLFLTFSGDEGDDEEGEEEQDSLSQGSAGPKGEIQNEGGEKEDTIYLEGGDKEGEDSDDILTMDKKRKGYKPTLGEILRKLKQQKMKKEKEEEAKKGKEKMNELGLTD